MPFDKRSNMAPRPTSAVPTRREKFHQATIDEIIALASEAAKEKGIENVTIKGIAQQMGMTPPAFYSYFKNRQELLQALVLEAYASFNQSLRSAIEDIPESDCAGRIFRYFIAWREWSIYNPHLFNLFVGKTDFRYNSRAKAVMEDAEKMKGALLELFDNAWKQGLIKSPEDNLEFSETYREKLEEIRKTYQFESPIEIINIGLRSGWLAHGMISIELSGRLYNMTGDTESHYQYQIRDMLHQFGLSLNSPGIPNT